MLDFLDKIEDLYINRSIYLRIDVERVIITFFCNIESKTIDKV